jgi:hypothetical protein
MAKVQLDLNNPFFQKEWFSLEKIEALALNKMLRKLLSMEWQQVYIDKGLRWEQIRFKTTRQGHNIYSLRFSQKYRVTAYRDNDYLVMLNIHVDHDSAYV